MNTAILDRAHILSEASSSDARISLTELARSSGWRKVLQSVGVVEVVDRTETAAFLVSREGMADLLETIDSLEEQLEAADVLALANARADRGNWMAGGALADAAWDEFAARRSRFQAVTNGD